MWTQNPGAKVCKIQWSPTFSNIMSFACVVLLYFGWGMGVLTGMTCWVLSFILMLWAPRVTVIELQRPERVVKSQEI